VTINENDIGFNLNSGISAFEAKDFTTALRLLSPLAEEGIAEAQYRMGMMFQNGLGRVKNQELGFKWMSAAAEQGHGYAQHGPGAQMALGMMYENGQGVEKNEVEARRWYKLSEENTG
jgi:TPR repeat protein